MQHDSLSASPGYQRLAPHLVGALAFVAIVVALMAPRSTPGGLVLLTLPAIAIAALAGYMKPPWSDGWLAAALAVFGVYLLINSSWSADRDGAIEKVVSYVLFAALVVAGGAAIQRLSKVHTDQLARAVMIGAGISIAILAVEVVFDQPIKRLATSLLPFLRPPRKHATVTDGWVTSVNLYVLNRNLAILNMVLWPALLILRARLGGAKARWLAAAGLVLAAAAVFRSEHETSMIALLVGCLVFVATLVWARGVRGAVLAGWIGVNLLVVPIATAAFSSGLKQAEWIPQTGRNRIVLWGVTAEKYREAPWFGVGIKSTKVLDAAAAETAVRLEGQKYPLRTGRHAHNIYLQTWYELGAVGALGLLVIGVMVLRRFARLPLADQPFAYASFSSAMVIASFSWGMWQPWFMGAFAIWAIVLTVALETAARQRTATHE